VVIFPEAEDVMRARLEKVKRYQPLLDILEEQDLRFIDVLDGFKRKNILSIGRLFRGHYTKTGNELVSEIVLESLDLSR
jgi:hypothetical protein